MSDTTFPIVITLAHPIPFGEQETITKITILRKPLAGDLRSAPSGENAVDYSLHILQKISDQPKSVIDRLELDDLLSMMEITSRFLPSTLQSGKNG